MPDGHGGARPITRAYAAAAGTASREGSNDMGKTPKADASYAKLKALRESGYKGPVDQDGNKVTSGKAADVMTTPAEERAAGENLPIIPLIPFEAARIAADKLIGPLTAEEWCSLRLGTDDDPFQCCGDTSALRDAAFHALRMGGGVEHGTELCAEWARVTRTHPDHTLAEHPVVGKLFEFYVKDKPPVPTDEEVDGWIADVRLRTQRAGVRALFERAGGGFTGDDEDTLDWLLGEELAEIADKATGSFRREHEALLTGEPTEDVQHVVLSHLLTVVSALQLVLGYEPTPVATEIVDQIRAERADEIDDAGKPTSSGGNSDE